MLRLNLNTAPLNFHISPYRYQHLLSIAQYLSASDDGEANQPRVSSVGAEKPSWFTDAEYQTKVRILYWEGVTASLAKWHHRLVARFVGVLVDAPVNKLEG